MKKGLFSFKGLLVFLLCVFFANAGMAQINVVIGSLTGSSSYFYGPYYRSSSGSSFDYSRYAYVYTPSELSIPPGSTIMAVAWRKANSGTITGNNVFDIWMDNTSSATLATNTAWATLTSTATQVEYRIGRKIVITFGVVNHVLLHAS